MQYLSGKSQMERDFERQRAMGGGAAAQEQANRALGV